VSSLVDLSAIAPLLERATVALERIAEGGAAAGAAGGGRDRERTAVDTDLVGIAAAARIVGYSVSGFKKLLARDADLVATYSRAGPKAHRRFSRRKLESWKRSRE